MAAKFYNITETEMNEFLSAKGFRKMELPNCAELVWGKRVDSDDFQLSMRVYSGINPSGQSRGVGKDAIRVVLVKRDPDGKIYKVGGSKRVNRVETWKKNLANRIDGWKVPSEKCCKCGNLMAERSGKNGDFLGCTNYPECKNTKSL